MDDLSRFRGIIFDLDGTLLDTLQDIGNAANNVLVRHGFPTHPISTYRCFVGDGVRMLLSRALPDEHRDEATLRACLETMQGEYLRNLNKTTRPYPGIPELLAELKQRSFLSAVLSNKPDEFTASCIKEYFGRDQFDPIIGLRSGRPRKPDPAGALEIAARWSTPPEDIAYLGDSGTDMETAKAAGMFPIGVLWGYRTKSELLAAGAKRLLKAPSDLL
jgi:phosphoglycolate phosphatase